MFNLLFYHFLGVSKTSTEAPCLPRHLPPSFILPGQLSDFEAALKRAAPAQPGTGQPGEVPWFQKCNNEDLARDIIYQSWVYWWFQNVSNTFDLKPPATGSGKALDTQHLSRVMFAHENTFDILSYLGHLFWDDPSDFWICGIGWKISGFRQFQGSSGGKFGI